ncbi:MAG: hypothetical protein M3N57_05965 [Actinomycetota bacterium]|nr:hypothetical protein [Actinomycetota bacterium]
MAVTVILGNDIGQVARTFDPARDTVLTGDVSPVDRDHVVFYKDPDVKFERLAHEQ